MSEVIDLNPNQDPKLDEILNALKDVIDPELGINIVDLGLLYDCRLEDDGVLLLDMTLTSAACPLQDVIEDQARQVLQDIASEVKFNWVWMPPWGPARITDDGREQLRAIGFNV
jgi:metal-sulfur cluster biosynthetic enzyme